MAAEEGQVGVGEAVAAAGMVVIDPGFLGRGGGPEVATGGVGP
jgi:hypothetical protein